MGYPTCHPDAPPLSDRLTLLRLRAQLAACDAGPLSSAFGTTLHGALGRALKLAVCSFPDPEHRPCPGCPALARCPYPGLFEPQPDKDAGRSGGTPPPALLLAPYGPTPTRVAIGTTLAMDLALVGTATVALPLVLAVLERMVAAGLGPARLPFTVVRVDALDAHGRATAAVQIGPRLSGQAPEPIRSAAWFVHADQGAPPGRVLLRVTTRMRLQHEGLASRQPPAFVDLARALVRRADALARAHGGEAGPFPDPRRWLAAAGQIRLAEAAIRWEAHQRRSASTGHTMPLDGFVGTLAYEGPPEVLGVFLPLLALGEAIGVGRGCSFGNGRYQREHTSGRRAT